MIVFGSGNIATLTLGINHRKVKVTAFVVIANLNSIVSLVV